MSDITAYHATYFAHELTKRSASDSVEKLASALVDAQVDLNPHQVTAALFAFRSPLSKGAILADEVGLGKTIEAGLVISQKWAERKRRILIIAPANLRKQWNQELQDKFFLPSLVLEAKSFNALRKQGHVNPLLQQDLVVIGSYEFAAGKAEFIQSIPWDLVVLDEAHRLRNVWEPGDSRSTRAKIIRRAVAHAPKILLTATPLQNSLLELYGLVSVVDEYAFGDLKSFKAQYSRAASSDTEAEMFQHLKERLRPLCQRTLRRQVLEYVRYTNRRALVEEFFPTDDEQRLYDQVTAYLQRDTLYALPASQRKLMTMILRRLLASSSFAISDTLAALVRRLDLQLNPAAATEGQVDSLETTVAADVDHLAELREEWNEDATDSSDSAPPLDASPLSRPTALSQAEQAGIEAEMALLADFETLARSIGRNAKGDKLIQALEQAFEAATAPTADGRRAARKAIIFTESTRTQRYLLELLSANGYAGQVVLFNGTNADDLSRQILARWLERYRGTDRVSGARSADMRAALVDYFRDEATIMIATEAAAEGINLQFCSLVVNYDLPWNPQRIEQRIGRCHRYGQEFDVVVLNFLNRQNAADVRVYELLRDKFHLFNGVFGASDEVLGALEGGVDFEQRIGRIYQRCRTPEQIDQEFKALRDELEVQITATMKDTRRQLLENFDGEVHEKLRINLAESKEYLNRYENWLWRLTEFGLRAHATFADGQQYGFTLRENPFPDLAIHPGPYRLGRASTAAADTNLYRLGHPLAQRLLEQCKAAILPVAHLVFDYTGHGARQIVMEPLQGQTGWLSATLLTIESFGTEDEVLLVAVPDTLGAAPLTSDQCRRMFNLAAQPHPVSPAGTPPTALTLATDIARQQVLSSLESRNATWFEAEMDKLDTWADDLKLGLEREIKDLDAEIKLRKAEAKREPELIRKVALRRQSTDLERKRDDKRQSLFKAQDDVEQRRDELLADIEKRLQQRSQELPLFTIRWEII